MIITHDAVIAAAQANATQDRRGASIAVGHVPTIKPELNLLAELIPTGIVCALERSGGTCVAAAEERGIDVSWLAHGHQRLQGLTLWLIGETLETT
ncbi:MAG: hypothetical protein Q8Q09_08495 [Deltaproteobacteria bacterium]|nr:hypothetical protein [Deltaproteobacteria bacterium]